MLPLNPEQMPKSLLADLVNLAPNEQQELQKMWQLTKNAQPPSPFDARLTEGAALWARIEAEAFATPQSNIKPLPQPTIGQGRMIWAWGIAATMALLLGVWLLFRNPSAVQPYQVKTLAKEMRTLTLPDGSQVRLNSSSSITFEETKELRKARLAGEATFDILHQTKPFVVETFNAQVRVLGTLFNVRTTPSRTTVALVRGRIGLSANGKNAVLLTPNQMAYVDGGKVSTPEATAVEQSLAWQAGGLYLKEAHLEEIVSVVAQRFGKKVELDFKTSKTLNIFYPENITPETLLKDVCIAYRCTMKKVENGYRLAPQ